MTNIKSEVLITISGIITLTDLKIALQRVQLRGVHDSEVLTLNKDGAPVTLRVVEDTLSDGSKVINYIIT